MLGRGRTASDGATYFCFIQAVADTNDHLSRDTPERAMYIGYLRMIVNIELSNRPRFEQNIVKPMT